MSEVLILEFAGATAEQYLAVNKILGVDAKTGEGDWPAPLQSHIASAVSNNWRGTFGSDRSASTAMALPPAAKMRSTTSLALPRLLMRYASGMPGSSRSSTRKYVHNTLTPS